ncbi:hypothetical protein PAPHI01_0061 [Pancytospora philotis]|nr:hypothetical protein PAPHI01_0061 [Pancytospora philotis]
MFEITDEDIKLLIDKHRSKKLAKAPVYDLKDLVKYGIMYLYGATHYQSGRVSPCCSAFSLYQPHSCSTKLPPAPATVGPAADFIKIQAIEPLSKSEDAAFVSWAGHNLALVTSGSELHAYFKKELLFKRVFPDCCVVKATSSKVYMGTHGGDITAFDPIEQTVSTISRHSDAITCLLPVGSGGLVSGSLDGTVFYKGSHRITGAGVLDVKYVGEDRLVCSCTDNTVALLDRGRVSTYSGHEMPIASLTYDKLCISSSLDGFFGVLDLHGADGAAGRALTMRDMQCSMHKQFGGCRALGYGLDEVSLIDLASMEKITSYAASSQAADQHGNTVVYASGSQLTFRDFRSTEKTVVDMHRKVMGVSYSAVGSSLLVMTLDTPYLLDLRYV